jgi:hypothetical protein
MVTTESGLQYKDIKVGEGPSPPIGFQVAQVITMLSNVKCILLFLSSHILTDCFTFCHVGCCKLCCYGAKWADFRQVRFGQLMCDIQLKSCLSSVLRSLVLFKGGCTFMRRRK